MAEKQVSARQEAGLVEEDFEQRTQADEAIDAGEHFDAEAHEEAGNQLITAQAKGNPYMSQEEQDLDMEPQVMGPPQYGSPDPVTSAGRLLPLATHPLRPDVLPEDTEAAISEDYGKDVEGYMHPSTATSHSITAGPSDLENDLQGGKVGSSSEATGDEQDYEEMSKSDLKDEAARRGLDDSGTKADLVAVLEEDDAAQTQTDDTATY